ncbi:hypothetical protein BP00DRAFT_361516 [Aspergillus indologenus CBS 114.80]|uniref:RNase III domain-containing protein n=1 Tax=Aspergillus indologenus CBS 114.80 TaxID=1450541 RepID=A0A2V5IQ56_9EURO|nr:hypothetical protein BP00DRAFT_361516 [Aspergillus indologenus CBS 114.80]
MSSATPNSDIILVKQVETLTGYRFQDVELLRKALTAAGADKDNHGGNRTLAQVGKHFISLCSVRLGYLCGTSPHTCSMMKDRIVSIERCAKLALSAKLDQIINFCPTSGSRSYKSLDLAINALIGAIYLESDSNQITTRALEQMRWFKPHTRPMSPVVLERDVPMNEPEELATSNDFMSANQPPESITEEYSQPKNAVFDSFMEEEAKACVRHGISPPQETYLNPRALRQILELQNTVPKWLNLPMLFLTFAGSQSIAGLHDNIHGSLGLENPSPAIFLAQASAKQRYCNIEALENLKCHVNLLIYYNTWQLIELCTNQEGTDLGVSYRPDASPQGPGNPINLRRADITRRILQIACPDLEPSSSSYSSIRHRVTVLRRTGERLKLLHKSFGLGIFGLMHSHDSSIPSLSHLLNIKINDRLFVEIISLLKSQQGPLIDEICGTVSPLVQSLIAGNSQHYLEAWIKSVKPDDLSKYPKGSDELLRLLRQWQQSTQILNPVHE